MHHECDLAANPTLQCQKWIRQGQTHPERAARSVEHTVNDRDGGNMHPLEGPFRSRFGVVADTDLPKICRGHEDFDPQRVDLREREDRTLIISILAWYEKALDHHAVDWASQRTLSRRLANVSQARNLAELRPCSPTLASASASWSEASG
jgi:hypothetical protein